VNLTFMAEIESLNNKIVTKDLQMVQLQKQFEGFQEVNLAQSKRLSQYAEELRKLHSYIELFYQSVLVMAGCGLFIFVALLCYRKSSSKKSSHSKDRLS